jgi:hypothetical protein
MISLRRRPLARTRDRRQTKTTSVTIQSTVKKCADFPEAKGLFATAWIPKGVVVARMNHPRILKSTIPSDAKLIEMWRLSRPGGDQSIYVKAQRAYYTDSPFEFHGSQAVRAPKWYRMNHSVNPTTKIQLQNGNRIEWVTLHDVQRGTALTWNYGHAPGMRKMFCQSAQNA